MRLMFIQSRYLPILVLVFLYLGNCLIMLFLGISPIHDAMVWLGDYHLFYTAFENGELPLWNPFSQSGTIVSELQNFGLIEPLTFIFILIKKLFNLSSFVIYILHYYSRFLIFLLGTYLTLNLLTKNKTSSLFFTLYLGMINYVNVLMQNGTINLCYLIPLMTYIVLLYINTDRTNTYGKIKLFFLFSICFAIMLNIYIPVGLLYYFCLFFIFAFIFKDIKLKEQIFLQSKKTTYLFLFGSIFVSFLFIMPMLAMFDLINFDTEMFPSLRYLQKNGHNLVDLFASDAGATALQEIFTGKNKVYLTLFNLIHIFTEPMIFFIKMMNTNLNMFPSFNHYFLSEVSIYLGIYPLLLVLFGLKNKISFFYTFLAIAVFSLLISCSFNIDQIDKPSFFQAALATLFPFLKMFEAYHLFGMIFLFALVVAAALQEHSLNSKIKIKLALFATLLYGIKLAIFGSIYTSHVFENVWNINIKLLLSFVFIAVSLAGLLQQYLKHSNKNSEQKMVIMKYCVFTLMTFDVISNIMIGFNILPLSIYQYTNVNNDYFSKINTQLKFNLYRKSFATLFVPFHASNILMNEYILYPNNYTRYISPIKLAEVNGLKHTFYSGSQFYISNDTPQLLSSPPYSFNIDHKLLATHLNHVYTGNDFIRFLIQIIGTENTIKYRQQLGDSMNSVPHTADTLFMQKYFYDFLMKINYDKQLIIGGVINPILNFYPEDKVRILSDKYQVVDAINKLPYQEVAEDLFIEKQIVKNEYDLNFEMLSDTSKYKVVKEFEYPKEESFFNLRPPNDNFKFQVSTFSLNKLSLIVDVAENGYIYYADGYSRHWRAFVDGEETEIFKTNINFKSVKLSKGKHFVEFHYEPTFFIIAYWGYFLGMILIFPFYYWIRFYELKYSSTFTG